MLAPLGMLLEQAALGCGLSDLQLLVLKGQLCTSLSRQHLCSRARTAESPCQRGRTGEGELDPTLRAGRAKVHCHI